jgi:hypothetical protein
MTYRRVHSQENRTGVQLLISQGTTGKSYQRRNRTRKEKEVAPILRKIARLRVVAQILDLVEEGQALRRLKLVEVTVDLVLGLLELQAMLELALRELGVALILEQLAEAKVAQRAVQAEAVLILELMSK